MKKALDTVNTNLSSMPADHLAPCPETVIKPAKKKTDAMLVSSIQKTSIKKHAVRFAHDSDDETKPLVTFGESPKYDDMGSIPSPAPKTPYSKRTLKAGHTPHKSDSGDEQACPQDSFMVRKFGHDYGIHHDYDHDYSLLNKTSSTTSQSIVSSTPNTQVSFGKQMLSGLSKSSITVQSQSSHSSSQSKASDTVLQDLLDFPNSPYEEVSSNDAGESQRNVSIRYDESQEESLTEVSDVVPDSESEVVPKVQCPQTSPVTFQATLPPMRSPLSTISYHRSATSENELTPQNGLSASFLLKDDDSEPSSAANKSQSRSLSRNLASASNSQLKSVGKLNCADTPKNPTPFQGQNQKPASVSSVHSDICAETRSSPQSIKDGSSHVKDQSSNLNNAIYAEEPQTTQETIDADLAPQQSFTPAPAVSKNFDLECLRTLREGYVRGKVSQARSVELLRLLYQVGDNEQSCTPETVPEIQQANIDDHFRPINPPSASRVRPQLDRPSPSVSTRPSSAPRLGRPSLVEKSIRDESVDVASMKHLSSHRKAVMDDLALSPRQSPISNVSPQVSEKMLLQSTRNSARDVQSPLQVHHAVGPLPEEASGYVADTTLSNIDSTIELSSSISVVHSKFSAAKPKETKQVTTIKSKSSETTSASGSQGREIKGSRAGYRSPGVSLNRPTFMQNAPSQRPINLHKQAQEFVRDVDESPKHDTSQVSLPYLGSNEPSFARRVGGTALSPDSNEPSFARQVEGAAFSAENNAQESDISSLTVNARTGVDVSIQCPSLQASIDSPITTNRPRSKSVGTSTDFSRVLTPTPTPALPRETSVKATAAYTPKPTYVDDTMSEMSNLSSVYSDLRQAVLRHNLQVPWPIAAPTPATNYISKAPLSTVSKARRVPLQETSNQLDESDYGSIESMNNVFHMKQEFDCASQDDMSMTSTIETASNSSLPSSMCGFLKETSVKQFTLQSLSHTINQKPSSKPEESAKKKPFDVNAVSFVKPEPTQTSQRSHAVQSSAKRVLMNPEDDDESVMNLMEAKDHTHDNDVSADFTCATTVTFDTSLDSQYQPIESAYPRLEIATKSRSRKQISESMKEINLVARPGGYTTVVLTFTNKRSSVMSLHPVIIQTRFDVADGSKLTKIDTTGFALDIMPDHIAFQVSPPTLRINPGEEVAIYVTFAPNNLHEGIYTGALKIKAKRKVSLMID
jgi:hypothetical protein